MYVCMYVRMYVCINYMYYMYYMCVCVCLSVYPSVRICLSMDTVLSGMEGGQSQFQLWTGGSLISFTVSLIIFVDHGHTDALSTNQ